MADRPLEPTLERVLNTIRSRLESVERTRTDFPVTSPLQGFDDGTPLGEVNFLNFGSNLHAVLTADGYVRVDGSSGGEGLFDAIVEQAATTNTGANPPIFGGVTGLQDAGNYLNTTLGLTTAAILVRPGAYVNSATTTFPSQTYLFGKNFGAMVNLTTGGPSWNHNGQTVTHAGASGFLYITNFSSVQPGGVKTSVFPSTMTVVAEKTSFVSFTNITTFSGGTYAHDCVFASFRGNLGFSAYLLDCDISWLSTASGSFVDSSSRLFMRGCVLNSGASGAPTIDLPTFVDMEYVTHDDSRAIGNGSAGPNWRLVNGASVRIDHSWSNLGGPNVTMVSGSPAQLILDGYFGDITIPHAANDSTYHIRGDTGGVDITGPAHIDITPAPSESSPLKVRGDRVTGDISFKDGHASGQAIEYISATRSNITAALNGSTASGTRKAASFDAASNYNVLTLSRPNGADYPAAITDAGTGNRVLPEGVVPSVGAAPADADYLVGAANGTLTNEIVVGTTPGGELGGTWASPTVDTTHSGSSHAGVVTAHEGAADPHTGYQLKSEKGVASGYQGIDANENLPVPGKVYPSTPAGALQTNAGLYAGTGAPNNADGANGDFYFNAAGGALTTIYHKRLGAWVGII